MENSIGPDHVYELVTVKEPTISPDGSSVVFTRGGVDKVEGMRAAARHRYSKPHNTGQAKDTSTAHTHQPGGTPVLYKAIIVVHNNCDARMTATTACV